MSTRPNHPRHPRDHQGTIAVTTDGPYPVRGGVPLTTGGIVYDDEGSGRACRRTWTLPPRQQYAPCRC